MSENQWVPVYNAGEGGKGSMISRIQEYVITLLLTDNEINRHINEGGRFTASYGDKFPIQVDATRPNPTAVLTIGGKVALRLERNAVELESSAHQ